jgi:hypothetical protein
MRELVHHRVAHRLRARLASINAEAEPARFWYTPDAVRVVDDLSFDHVRRADRTTYLLRGADDRQAERAGRNLDLESEFFLLATRRLVKPQPTAHAGNETLVRAEPWRDGPLAAIGQPTEPSLLRVLVADVVTPAGRLTVEGTNAAGEPLSAVFDLGQGAEQMLLEDADVAAFKTVASLEVSGAGLDSPASVTVEAWLTIPTVQDRLIRDVKVKLLEDITIGGLTHNLEITDVGRGLFIQENSPWAAVEFLIVAKYLAKVAAP